MIISCLSLSQILFKYCDCLNPTDVQRYYVSCQLLSASKDQSCHQTLWLKIYGAGNHRLVQKGLTHTLPKLLLIQVPPHLSWQTSQTFGPCSRDDIEWVWAAWLHLATDHERVRKSPPFALGHPHTEGCEGRRRRFGSEQLCRKPLQRQSEVAGVQLAVHEGHVGGLIPSFPPDHGSQTTTGEYFLWLQVNAKNYWLREAKTVENVN